jgi:hypothetical protein
MGLPRKKNATVRKRSGASRCYAGTGKTQQFRRLRGSHATHCARHHTFYSSSRIALLRAAYVLRSQCKRVPNSKKPGTIGWSRHKPVYLYEKLTRKKFTPRAATPYWTHGRNCRQRRRLSVAGNIWLVSTNSVGKPSSGCALKK